MTTGPRAQTRERLRRLNVVTMAVVTLTTGTLVVAVTARTWPQAVVLGAGAIAAFVASVRWTAVGIPRVVPSVPGRHGGCVDRRRAGG